MVSMKYEAINGELSRGRISVENDFGRFSRSAKLFL